MMLPTMLLFGNGIETINGSLKDLQAAVQDLTRHNFNLRLGSNQINSHTLLSHTHKEESYIKDITLKHPAKKHMHSTLKQTQCEL